MAKAIYGEVNEIGRQGLLAWLEGVLREPQYAESWADKLLESVDGSDAAEIGISVEVSGLKTREGNPETYRFSRDEFDLIEIED